MKIAVLKETFKGEKRVAAIPETVKKFVQLGIQVSVEKGAGSGASYLDDAYTAAGATLKPSADELCADADVLLTVRGLTPHASVKRDVFLIGMLNPYQNRDTVQQFADQGIHALALELMPRITRAQSMDVLSSQANLAGYRAVIEAAYHFNQAFPMMMTAAGTIVPARVLVLGAGVAGLQAIATAKRLGAIVSAFDVRKAAKEQVESLGGKFVEVDHSESGDVGSGYAKEMSSEYQKRQAEKIHEQVKKSDIVICTALIPGKPAPKLMNQDMVDDMKPGSVIVDMAAEMGGNCGATRPGQVRQYNHVVIIGHQNYASLIAKDSAAVYSRNIYHLIHYLYNKHDKKLDINRDDDITKSILLTYQGATVHDKFKDKGEK